MCGRSSGRTSYRHWLQVPGKPAGQGPGKWFEVLRHAPYTARYYADPISTPHKTLNVDAQKLLDSGVVELAGPGQFIRDQE